MRNIFLPKIIKGELYFGQDNNQGYWREFLKKNEGKTLRIELPQAKRSNQQNKYFWFYLSLIESETGNDTKSMHEYTVRHLTPKVEKYIKLFKDGKWIEHRGMVGKGTSELTKLEMGDTLDRLCALVDVPLPDPHLLENFIPNY